MYLEAKTLEVVALELELILTSRQTSEQPLKLQRDDIDRIPPSLMELARLVGLNERKLKIGFREVFKTTAFSYLHDCQTNSQK